MKAQNSHLYLEGYSLSCDVGQREGDRQRLGLLLLNCELQLLHRHLQQVTLGLRFHWDKRTLRSFRRSVQLLAGSKLCFEFCRAILVLSQHVRFFTLMSRVLSQHSIHIVILQIWALGMGTHNTPHAFQILATSISDEKAGTLHMFHFFSLHLAHRVHASVLRVASVTGLWWQ